MNSLKYSHWIIITIIFFTSFAYSQNSWDDYVSRVWGGKFSPYIEAYGAYGSISHNDFSGSFANLSGVDLKFGFTELKDYKDYIQALDERYMLGSYFSSDLAGSSGSGNVKTEMWRFALGNRLGFGYKINNSALIPYNQMQLAISNPEFSDTAGLSSADSYILNRVQGDYRMGSTYEGGVKFYIAKTFSVSTGIEGAIIFPRYKFLHWSGSYMLQAISLGVVSYFSEAIVNSSPFFGPIMYFILKNGISAAWYFALKDNMYWPIKSEKPLSMETFRVGASFTF